MQGRNLFHVQNWRFWQSYFSLQAKRKESYRWKAFKLQAPAAPAIELRQVVSTVASAKLEKGKDSLWAAAFKLREKGSITTFVALFLAALITLLTILLPAGRLRLLEMRIPDFVNLQLQQILASYERPLLDRYGLLAFPDAAVNDKQLQRLLDADYQNYRFQSKVQATTALFSPPTLEKQILRYMRSRAPLASYKLFKQRFADFFKVTKEQLANKDLVAIGKSADEAKTLIQKLTAFLKSIAAETDANKAAKRFGRSLPKAGQTSKFAATADSSKLLSEAKLAADGADGIVDIIKEKLQALIAQGVLSALDKFSDGYAELKQLASASFMSNLDVSNFASLFNTLSTIQGQVQSIGILPLDSLLLNEYIITFCSSAVRNSQASIPTENKISTNLSGRGKLFQSLTYSSSYETEECAAWSSAFAKTQIQAQIFLIRFLLQFTALQQDQVRTSTYRTFANLIAAFLTVLGIVFPAEAIFHCFLIVDAGLKAFGDLKLLLSGKTLDLLPEKLGNVAGSVRHFQHDYLDYLRLFLLFRSSEAKLTQLARIMSTNVNAEQLYLQVELQLEYEAPWKIGKSRSYTATLAYYKDLAEGPDAKN